MTENKYSALIGINLYSVLFVYLFIQFLNALLNITIVPENKALYVLFVYHVYCNVYLCSIFQ